MGHLLGRRLTVIDVNLLFPHLFSLEPKRCGGCRSQEKQSTDDDMNTGLHKEVLCDITPRGVAHEVDVASQQIQFLDLEVKDQVHNVGAWSVTLYDPTAPGPEVRPHPRRPGFINFFRVFKEVRRCDWNHHKFSNSWAG